MQKALFGLGCFWGAGRIFWKVPRLCDRGLAIAAGVTPNPTYQEVCSGEPVHSEVVLVVFDPKVVGSRTCSAASGKRTIRRRACEQGNDVGTQ